MSKGTILVVEDERIIAHDLQLTLHRAGYRVPAVTASGEEAVILANALHPDLVLMDIVLQGTLDGISAAEQIRKQTKSPVVYLSSYGDQAVLERAKNTEPIGYILKPYEEKDLLTTIEVVLHQFRNSRKREESALLATEARFRTIFETSVVGIGLVDREGHLIESNPALQRMVGYSAAELREGTFSSVTHPHDRDLEDMLFSELLAGKRNAYHLEKRATHKKGHQIWLRVSVSAFPHQSTDGQRHFALRFIEDISEEKQREEQLLRAQRMETIGALTSGLAHNLNNVLSPVLVGVDMLRNTCTDTESLELLKTMDTSLQRGAGIVRQLLAFGRGGETRLAPMQPVRVFTEIAALVKELYPKNILLQVQIPPAPWSVQGDANQLHQAVLNLCTNARDAMPNGGTITLASENVTLDATHTAPHPGVNPGPYVLLRIQDTGSGMTEEVLNQIFAPFFTTKPAGKGTGLGLATTLNIVKRHNGFIEVQSAPGKGTEFRLYLPALQAARATTPLVAPAPTPAS